MIQFRKKTRLSQEIPTGPMADISFLLIIFFMVSTVFVVYRGFPVDLPGAGRVDPITSKRNIATVWIAPDGSMMVDEYTVDLTNIAAVVRGKLRENPRLVVLIKSDRGTPYRLVSGVIEELKKADALRVAFIARREQ